MSKGEGRRDAIRAFRKYARLGLDREDLDVFDAYERMRGATQSRAAALDMLAVYDTMRILTAFGEEDAADAVRAVYFASWGRLPSRSDIGMRVLRFSAERFCDERTVYRKLQMAKRLYETVRSGQKIFSKK